MLISDGSSDVCSSDLCAAANLRNGSGAVGIAFLVCLQGGRTTLVEFGQVVIALLAHTSSVIFAQLGYRRKTRAILDHCGIIAFEWRSVIGIVLLDQDRKSTRLNSSH